MICEKCRAENASDQKFCGQCGAKLRPAPGPVPVPGEPGAFFCHRHPKVATRVRCGRCGQPICTRCAVEGPVGLRCRDCARQRVAIRPRAVLHGASKTLGSGAHGAGRVVWYLALWHLLLSLFNGFFGGHRDG